MLSFIDEEQEDDKNPQIFASKPAGVKLGGKVSLFGNKMQKVADEGEEADYIAKRKVKGFGKDPEVNTSFLPDEDKDVEDEIKKQKLMNKVYRACHSL